MNELRKIFKDLKNLDFIESYIVVAVGLVVFVMSLFNNLTNSVMFQVILAALSALIYLTIMGRRETKELYFGDIEGIITFHPNRDKLIPLDHWFNKAKKEIVLYAVQHSAVVHQYLGLLKDKAENGCRIKILMMSARMPDGEVNPNVRESESQRRYTGLLPQIENNTKTLREWWESLSESARQVVEVRMYQEYPVATYTFIDRDEANGFVLVEIQHYGVHVHDMPHYIVTKKDDSSARFFQTHCESFDRLWSRSCVLNPIVHSDEVKNV
jgi:hypothetical protein